jgi:hypothetical protein
MATLDFASRKFLLCTVVLLAGIAALFFNFAKWNEFLELAKWVLGIYVTANVAERAVDKIGGHMPTDPNPPLK